ncbi:MAG TPA: winged helix-turn-helix transcriptional regulator [Actinobacteria bacterium]|nr:winged helix-turn-helix transcriptional regulator [Actinomycetota bacterium]
MKTVNDSDKDDAVLKETEALQNLRALEEIEKNPQISQRELSSHLGVALGITNALLKTLARKGQIKIRGKNNRSLTYHLTHAGVLAKSSLAMRWTLNTIGFYRQARHSIAQRLSLLAEDGAQSVVLYGHSELTEIVSVLAPEVGMKIVGIAAPHDTNRTDNEESFNRGEVQFPGFSSFQLEDIGEIAADALIVCKKCEPDEIAEIELHASSSMRIFDLF